MGKNLWGNYANRFTKACSISHVFPKFDMHNAINAARRLASGKEYNLISFFLASYENDDSPTPLACLEV